MRSTFQLSSLPLILFVMALAGCTAGNPVRFASTVPSSNETVHTVAHTTPAKALITLGPNDDFQTITAGATGNVLVDFYADWCGPCRQQGGILHAMENAAAEHNALIVKVNVDQHPRLAEEFDISSLPTLLLMKNGEVIEHQIGLAHQSRIAGLLAQ